MRNGGPAAGFDTIKVLIVDDSAAVRQALIGVLSTAPDIEVVGTAGDPYAAAERMRDVLPDVIFLDIEMPRMDGLTFLRKIMAQRPIPVVICSTLTEEGSQAFAEALEAGAVDVITKPKLATAQGLADAQMRIVDVARAAAHAKVGTRRKPAPPVRVEKKLTADAVIAPPSSRAAPILADPLICIGASTGGTEAIREVLTGLPASIAGIVIVQHMPEYFTGAFARRLNSLCAVTVKEAADGDAVLPGQALIAPGNRHMMVVRTGRTYRVAIKDGPHVSRHRPSVDVLFRSAAQAAGSNAIGVILTGMGDDGAQGLLEMRQAGAATIAQDEESCVVYGMPKEAVQRGAAAKILPLRGIAGEIVSGSRGLKRTGSA